MKQQITRNSIRCKHCGDTTTSTHRHDYQSCKCGKVAVDGGTDYLRRAFVTDPETDYEELSEFTDEIPIDTEAFDT